MTSVTGWSIFGNLNRFGPTPRWQLPAVGHPRAGRSRSKLVQTHRRPCGCLACRSESDALLLRLGDDDALPSGLRLVRIGSILPPPAPAVTAATKGRCRDSSWTVACRQSSDDGRTSASIRCSRVSFSLARPDQVIGCRLLPAGCGSAAGRGSVACMRRIPADPQAVPLVTSVAIQGSTIRQPTPEGCPLEDERESIERGEQGLREPLPG